MAVRVGDVRAEDDGIKEPARCLFALVELELFGSILKHVFEERLSGPAARAIKYQNSFIPLPANPVSNSSRYAGHRGDEIDAYFPLNPVSGVTNHLMVHSRLSWVWAPSKNHVVRG